MVLMAKKGGQSNVITISETMGFSKHHVAKVLQRLVKSGFLKSNRGPLGGFTINKPLSEISLLDLYESIEGKIAETDCPMDYHLCPFKDCLMGNMVNDVTLVLKDYMASKSIEYYISNKY